MLAEFSNVQSLHVKGIVKICVDRKSKQKVLTCGTDGTVMSWTEKALLGEEEPETSPVIGDSTSASIASENGSICVGYSVTDFISGIDKRTVGKTSLDDFENVLTLVSFSLDVTALDSTSDFVVAGASDYSVKKVSFQSLDNVQRVDLDGEPLCIKIDPQRKFIAISSVNGAVTILSVEPLSIEFTHKNVFPSFGAIDASNALVTVSWSVNGDELFVPSKGVVKAFKRDEWSSAEFFKSKGSEMETFSTCCVSDCGTYLAASTLTNVIHIWDVKTRNEILRTEYTRKAPGKTVVTSIEFSPFNSTELIIADSNEGICVLKNALKETTSAKTIKASEDVQAMEEDDDDDIIINRSRRPNFIDDEADDDGEDENSRLSASSFDIGAIKRKYGHENRGMSALEEYGFGQVDETSQVGSDGDKNTGPTGFSGSMKQEKPAVVYKPYVPVVKTIPTRFVSGSSPVELSQRYLKWNSYGVVRSYMNKIEKSSSIEIEFHDATVHSEIIIDNFEPNYQFADLSDVVVVLASAEDKQKEKELEKGDELMSNEIKGTSELFVIHIGTWDLESKQWKTLLPRGDGAIDVLATRKFVGVITVKRNIRIFTLAGTQRQVIAHPGSILTATAFDEKIAIASICGAEYYEEDKKTVAQYNHVIRVYDVDGRDWYQKTNGVTTIDLPVSADAKLDWLGFTNNGNIVSADSHCNWFVHAPNGSWMPIFDGTPLLRSQSDGIWPISVVETPSRQIRYIYCRGTKHPLVSLNTAPTISQWKIPLCQPSTEKTELEHELLFNELNQANALMLEDAHSIEDLRNKYLATIIKLFAFSCKTDRDSRAAELASLVTSAKGIQLLCNYATKKNKSTLSEKVAATGRSTVSVTTSSQSMLRPSERVIAPRRSRLSNITTGRSSFNRSVIDEDAESTFTMPSRKDSTIVRNGDEAEFLGDDDFEEPQSQMSSVMNTTIESVDVVIPPERIGRNPFKRNNDLNATQDSLDTSSVSIFDQLEVPVDRKRARDEETPKSQPVKKQAKLVFGSSSKGKENAKQPEKAESEEVVEKSVVKQSATPYSMWLAASEQALKERFSGDESEFAKFCVQSFRNLAPAQKKEWKAKAEAAAV